MAMTRWGSAHGSDGSGLYPAVAGGAAGAQAPRAARFLNLRAGPRSPPWRNAHATPPPDPAASGCRGRPRPADRLRLPSAAVLHALRAHEPERARGADHRAT